MHRSGLRGSVLALMCALSGCITAQVVPTADGTYAVMGHGKSGSDPAQNTNKALKEALEFCAAKGLKMEPKSTGVSAVGGELTTLTFSCVSA
ncbi:MAG TPA: hypothetical protein VMG11_14560 [Steroidobacteraceae bacterium]|nr:hypothetical protein [Steroidobacteraceae bacterium]